MWKMNTPRKIWDILPSTCQKLLKSVEICLSSDKNNFAVFLRHGVVLLSPWSLFHWLQNTWPWMSLNGHFSLNSVLRRYVWTLELWSMAFEFSHKSWISFGLLAGYPPSRHSRAQDPHNLKNSRQNVLFSRHAVWLTACIILIYVNMYSRNDGNDTRPAGYDSTIRK